jgi:hypothetical protein
MDNLRAFEENAGLNVEEEEEIRMEAPPEIGFDERRMHVRAYNYWVSLLGGRIYPSIGDLEPADLDDFGPHSVLLDFTRGSENPSIAYVGKLLREQCDLTADIDAISQVPHRSLLSRLTDHYLQIIANRAPIGFEAEFVSMKGYNTMYRGILMPFSSDGETIDFIYGVINWKELADSNTMTQINEQVDRALAASPAIEASPVWADGPHAIDSEIVLQPALPPFAQTDDTLELGVQYIEDDATAFLPGLGIGQDDGLADKLSLARESADAVKAADGRSRAALYQALGEAYDFALAADEDQNGFAELLEDAGLTVQERAPMTPVVKLIFGVDYDKARVTEFAAALSYCRRQQLPAGAMRPFLEEFAGGLKAMVRAERQARRPEPRADAGEEARATLRGAQPLALVDVPSDGEEFVLLIARRQSDGRLAVIAPVPADQGLIDRAIRKTI